MQHCVGSTQHNVATIDCWSAAAILSQKLDKSREQRERASEDNKIVVDGAAAEQKYISHSIKTTTMTPWLEVTNLQEGEVIFSDQQLAASATRWKAAFFLILVFHLNNQLRPPPIWTRPT